MLSVVGVTCHIYSRWPVPALNIAGLLTTGPGNPSLRTPGNRHYAHLCLIISHTWTSDDNLAILLLDLATFQTILATSFQTAPSNKFSYF